MTGPSQSRACDRCRRLHHKCDYVEPQCSSCRKGSLRCRRTEKLVRFKQPTILGSLVPTTDAFMIVPQTIHFVNQTSEFSGKNKTAIKQKTTRRSEPKVDLDLQETQVLDHQQRLRTPSPASRDNWPLNSATESLLLKHFVHKIAPCFFDFCDPERHFALTVPQRARTCSPLLFATLALSARHLGHTEEEFDERIGDEYYQRCLEALIPELNSKTADLDDNLLAATVILRVFEELNTPLAGVDLCQHSVGTYAFLRSQTSQIPCVGLRRAASWAGVRQEIYISISRYRSPSIKATDEMLASIDMSTDSAWTEIAISHCSDVLEFCFENSPGTVEKYKSLLWDHQRWNTQRPSSYDPFFSDNNPDLSANPFGEFALLADWHVMGWQYMTLARLLLVMYEPRFKKTGTGTGETPCLKETREQARKAVKLLCSIAESNPGTAPGIVMACIGAKLSGELFEDKAEQRALLDVLDRAEREHGWPTKEVRNNLSKGWTNSS